MGCGAAASYPPRSRLLACLPSPLVARRYVFNIRCLPRTPARARMERRPKSRVVTLIRYRRCRRRRANTHTHTRHTHKPRGRFRRIRAPHPSIYTLRSNSHPHRLQQRGEGTNTHSLSRPYPYRRRRRYRAVGHRHTRLSVLFSSCFCLSSSRRKHHHGAGVAALLFLLLPLLTGARGATWGARRGPRPAAARPRTAPPPWCGTTQSQRRASYRRAAPSPLG